MKKLSFIKNAMAKIMEFIPDTSNEEIKTLVNTVVNAYEEVRSEVSSHGEFKDGEDENIEVYTPIPVESNEKFRTVQDELINLKAENIKLRQQYNDAFFSSNAETLPADEVEKPKDPIDIILGGTDNG